MAWDQASEEFSLWPDDQVLPTNKEGAFRRMDGQRYFLDRHLFENIPTLIQDYKVQITEYIRNGGDLVELTTENIGDALQRRAPTLAQKLERLLRSLARRTSYQAGHVRLHQHGTSIEQFPLMRDAGIATRQELKSLLDHLSLRNLASYWESTSRAEARITVEGVLEVERMTAPSSESQSAFIAMWFDTQMIPAHHAIERAIVANDYVPDRVDKRDYNHKVDDEIIARVRAARFIVADFSCGQDTVRGGVYFEAGFGLALEKPVIFTVRETDIDRLHFDTRQFNHIVWQSESGLEEALRNRIGRTIGKYRST